jgi:hypothetical protein
MDVYMNACCQASLNTAFLKWAHENEAQFGPDLEVTLVSGIKRFAPAIARLLNDANAQFFVANSKGLIDAFTSRSPCRLCGAPIHLVIIGAPFLIATWRLQMIGGTLVTGLGLEGMAQRWALREEDDRDREQVHEIVSACFRNNAMNLPLFDALFEKLESSPPTLPHAIMTKVAALGELWLLCHELGHVVPLAQVSNAPFFKAYGDGLVTRHKLSPERAGRWVDELKADLAATCILSWALDNKEACVADDEEPGEDVYLFTAEAWAHAAATGAIGALSILESTLLGARSPKFRFDWEFREHPPAADRHKIMRHLCVQVHGEATMGFADFVAHLQVRLGAYRFPTTE